MTDSRSSRLYYGWKIVAALLVVLTFASGLSFYNHAIYLNALSASPSFSVSSASLAVSVFFLSSGVAGLVIARAVQRFDVRLSFTVGAVLCFLALSTLAWVNTFWQLIVVYAVFGAGFAASALLPATTLITRWFRRRRAMALSVASTGLSLGGVVVTPLSALMVENLGFATAAPLMGVMYLLGVIPVAWIWLRPDPAAVGLGIDGGPIEVVETGADGGRRSASHHEQGIAFRDALRGRLYWGIALAYIFLMLAQVGGIAHQYGLAREILSEAQTAAAVAILPVASIVGRLIGGWLVEQVSIRLFAISMMVMQAVSLSLLSGGFNVWTLCIGLFCFGSSVGNLLMLQPLLLAEAFGVRDYARLFSVSNLMSSWGTALGPALMGVAYTASANHYALPYLVAAGAGLLGLLLFLAGGPLHRDRETAAP
jgi:MFS family permease